MGGRPLCQRLRFQAIRTIGYTYRCTTTDAFSPDTNRASRHRATRRLEAALDVPCALATGGGSVLGVGELVGDRYVERRIIVAIVEGDAVAVVLAHPLVVRGEEV